MTIGTFFIGLSLAIEASPQNEDEARPWVFGLENYSKQVQTLLAPEKGNFAVSGAGIRFYVGCRQHFGGMPVF